MNKFLLAFLIVLTFSCQLKKNSYSKLVGYHDILFSDAWQIALASLTQKGNILTNNQDKGKIIIKIHKTPVDVKLRQITPVTVQYIISSRLRNRSSVELVRAILKNNFEQQTY